MNNIKGLTISESIFKNEDGSNGKIAVFMYSGLSNPSSILDYAIKTYVEDQEYIELTSSSLSNVWMRVILSNINKMKQEPFDKNKHKLR
jgi:hypothetical protein